MSKNELKIKAIKEYIKKVTSGYSTTINYMFVDINDFIPESKKIEQPVEGLIEHMARMRISIFKEKVMKHFNKNHDIIIVSIENGLYSKSPKIDESYFKTFKFQTSASKILKNMNILCKNAINRDWEDQSVIVFENLKTGSQTIVKSKLNPKIDAINAVNFFTTNDIKKRTFGAYLVKNGRAKNANNWMLEINKIDRVDQIVSGLELATRVFPHQSAIV